MHKVIHSFFSFPSIIFPVHLCIHQFIHPSIFRKPKRQLFNIYIFLINLNPYCIFLTFPVSSILSLILFMCMYAPDTWCNSYLLCSLPRFFQMNYMGCFVWIIRSVLFLHVLQWQFKFCRSHTYIQGKFQQWKKYGENSVYTYLLNFRYFLVKWGQNWPLKFTLMHGINQYF